MTPQWTLQIVIPTRNRADLAASAVQSVIDAGLPRVRIMVSDNSTQPDEAERLAAHYAGTPVQYIRPSKPLAMAAHWEWALGRALDDTSVTHVAFLTDRMMFQEGGLKALLDAMACWPAQVITFAQDRVNDYRYPVELEQSAWSGHVLEVSSNLFVWDWSAVKQATGMAMPRLLNSIVPRSVIDLVRSRFGTVCGNSTSPDFAFAFRSLAVLDSLLYYDRPAIIHYALDRSNGASVARGMVSADHADFMHGLDGSSLLPDAPLPGALTVLNAIMQEYCAVRSVTDWPSVDLIAYLEAIEQEVTQMEAGPRKWQLLEQIRGFQEGATLPSARRATVIGKRPMLRLARSPRHFAHRLWMKYQRSKGLPDGNDAVYPPVRVTTWESRKLAVEFARKSPRKPHRLLSNVELALGPDVGRHAIRRVGAIRA